MDAAAVRSAAAANLAAWHDASTRALGWRPATTRGWWLCATPAPNIYHSAVSLQPARGRRDRDRLRAELRAHLDDPDSVHVSVCDAWDELDLGLLGLTCRATSVWSARPPGPTSAPPSTGITIERVGTTGALAAFEETVVRGFGARPPIAPFDIHGTAILDDPSMHVFLGRTADAADPVAVSMAYVTSEVVGIYGVATVPDARGHGHATAMTLAALAVAPDRPAILQPSPAAYPLYRRLGFTDLGAYSHWTR